MTLSTGVKGSNAAFNRQNLLILFFICGFTNAACTTRQIALSDMYPQIYLYTTRESDQRVSAVSQALEAYPVVMTDLPVPTEFTSTTIIYAPIVNPNAIDNIASSLEQLGYTKIEKVFRAAANHSYGRFNVGVYLVPPK